MMQARLSRSWLSSALRDSRGATIVEFAFVAPVLTMFIMGSGDLLLQAYVTSVIHGEVQRAGRDTTLQTNSTSSAANAIDVRVIAAARRIAPHATYSSTRKNYNVFSKVGKIEPFTDANSDGIRQVGECYSDVNGNNQWDADQGLSGVGGASDVGLYTITVTYKHFFPVAGLFGNNNAVIKSATVLMNQPYAAQTIHTPASVCT